MAGEVECWVRVMEEMFNSEIERKRQSINVNGFFFTKTKYETILKDVINAKLITTRKEPRDYRLLKRYDVIEIDGILKLIVPLKADSSSSDIQFYVTDEELFEILHETHILVNHGGRDRMMRELRRRYKNITYKDVLTYLELCEQCLMKQKRERKGEDRKLDMSSMVNANLMDNSMGDVPGPSSEDQPIPLSPEQYLTEEMELPNTPHSVPVPPRPESYKLRHNNHLSLVLESLAGDESFMDVTLTAQGKAIKAHKSVLSAVSSYFKSVLKTNPCQHPIIIMPRDILFEELNSIISYVYKGEMTVAAEDLPSLLRTAEILQVTGLTPSDSSAMGSTSSSILRQIGSRGTKSAASAVNQNIRASPTKSSNKRSQKFYSTPIQKEAQQNSSYDNDLSDKGDPLDFSNTDMAYVKEEIESDSENIADAETSVDNDFNAPVVQSDNKSSDSHTSQKGCPLSKKRKTSVDASSLQADTGETENNPDSLLDDSLSNQTALFVCPYCFQSHRPTEVLQAHLRLKHPSKPSFLCKCGKVTLRQSLYDQHVETCDSS